MRTIYCDRQAPAGNQWQEALHAAMLDELTDRLFVGVGSFAPTNQVIVYLTKFADGDDENRARVLVANHDMDTRTETQVIAAATPSDAERIALLEAAILELLEGGI